MTVLNCLICQICQPSAVLLVNHVTRYSYFGHKMSTARHRGSASPLLQGDIQDPSITSTVVQVPIPIPELTTVIITNTGFRSALNLPPTDSNISKNLSTSKALVIVACIFLTSLLVLGILYKHFPDLEEHERQYLKLPFNLDEAKHLGLVLDRYKDKYFLEVLMGVFLVYIFLQTFAIPGSIFLSILSGFLFPFYLALLLVCCCSALGASLCFFLSNLLGKKLVKKFFPERAAQWSKAVEKHKNNLLNYVIFLRVTPFLPNWFINMSAPVIGVPLLPFALGTFIGVAPPSFMAIQAGQTLHTLTSTSDAWSWTSVTILTFFAIISLVPVLLKHKLREKFE